MKIEIDFNNSGTKDLYTKEFFEHINAKSHTEEEYYYYYVEVDTLEELEELHKKINLYLTRGKNNFEYSFVMSFDPAVIYIEKNF